jgi:hypothetical protein
MKIIRPVLGIGSALALGLTVAGGILVDRAFANPAAPQGTEKPPKPAQAQPLRLKPARRLDTKWALIYLAFSADGKTLASGGKEAIYWNWATGKEVRKRVPWGDLTPKEQAWFNAAANRGAYFQPTQRLSPDGKVLVTITNNRFFNGPVRGDNRGQRGTAEVRVRVVDAATRQELHTYVGKGTCIARMGDDNEPWARAAPDARAVLIRDEKGFHLWDTGTGKSIRTIHPQLKGDRGPLVHPTAYSPDGKLLLFNQRLWEVATGTPLAALDTAVPATFSPDGKVLATGQPVKPGEVISVGLVWDVTAALSKAAGLDVRKKLGLKERERLWAALGDAEASRAYPMVAVLVTGGDKGVVFFKDRLGRLVKKGEELRRLRAVAALEQIGSGKARAVLKSLAEKAPDARAAKDALARLAKRKSP